MFYFILRKKDWEIILIKYQAHSGSVKHHETGNQERYSKDKEEDRGPLKPKARRRTSWNGITPAVNDVDSVDNVST